MAGALEAENQQLIKLNVDNLQPNCGPGGAARPSRAHAQPVIGLRQRNRGRGAQIADGRASYPTPDAGRDGYRRPGYQCDCGIGSPDRRSERAEHTRWQECMVGG